ncbi:MAG: hypothetical protein K8R90_09980 [Candidatus Cloacimonetes bacterium]|nr:hypothetical protein [Candidatus Cloacimonadota bacterium]
MTTRELIQAKKLEVTNEYERLKKLIAEANAKLLKTQGAYLILQHLEQQIDMEA